MLIDCLFSGTIGPGGRRAAAAVLRVHMLEVLRVPLALSTRERTSATVRHLTCIYKILLAVFRVFMTLSVVLNFKL